MNKDFDFKEVGKRMPYRTPEGFFERMQAETLKRVEEEKRRKKTIRLNWGLSVALVAAAMVCGILFFPKTQQDITEQPVADEWLMAMTDGMDEMDLYVQGLSDEDLDAWIEFSENDIYYELTTENLNEDEN